MSIPPETAELPIPPASEDRCCELVALRTPAASAASVFGEDWPIAPGAVRRAPSGAAQLLHFAPGRWLMPEPDAALMLQAGKLVAGGAAELIEVEGKWRKLALSGAAATRVLSAGVAVESVLAARECAALTLFDCPVILARRLGEFDLWVQSSYFPSLEARLESIELQLRGA